MKSPTNKKLYAHAGRRESIMFVLPKYKTCCEDLFARGKATPAVRHMLSSTVCVVLVRLIVTAAVLNFVFLNYGNY